MKIGKDKKKKNHVIVRKRKTILNVLYSKHDLNDPTIREFLRERIKKTDNLLLQ